MIAVVESPDRTFFRVKAFERGFLRSQNHENHLLGSWLEENLKACCAETGRKASEVHEYWLTNKRAKGYAQGFFRHNCQAVKDALTEYELKFGQYHFFKAEKE